MRKQIFIAGIVAGICAVSAVMTVSAAVSEEEAKQIALDMAGVEEEEVTVRVNRDREDGQEIYEVQIWSDTSEEYEYDIFVESGEILEASYEQRGIAEGKGTAVSLEEAKELAAEKAGISVDEAVFTKEESDHDDGRSIWELEFFTEDQREYEYEIDCDTGMILDWSYDGERHLAWKAANPDKALERDTSSGQDISQGHHEEEHHQEEHHTEAHENHHG